MTARPFSFTLNLPAGLPTHFDRIIERRLSAMRGQYFDEAALEAQLAQDDPLIYEVYEVQVPPVPGELLTGVTVIHPGRVGREFHMTKGHFHAVRETAEVYLCLSGEGSMVMENDAGETAVESFTPGKVLYVPPGWAHRSICTGRQQDLVFFWTYPAHAGHDYGTIEQRGFRKLVLAGADGSVEIVDNPRWSGEAG
jgi:glucose-6-phosphate isomerase